MIPLQQVQKETAYRLYFEGVRGPDDAPLEDGEGAQANIGVSLVWGLWSMSPRRRCGGPAPPDNTLHNTGTLRVGIIGAEQCTAAGACTPHPVSHSLYPDAALTLPFQLQPGNSLQLRYRLTRDGYREHVRTIEPTAT